MTLTRMKEYWNAVAGRATTAIYVAAVLTAKLHAATSGPDNPVPNIFDHTRRRQTRLLFSTICLLTGFGCADALDLVAGQVTSLGGSSNCAG